MSELRVINAGQIPWRLPLFPSITLWLLMDRLQPPPVVCGIVGTLWAIICLGAIACVFKQTHCKVRFEDGK